ncbi:PIN domain-containing protein (plasmid) [Rhodococcus aetherivorans]|uniref:PIN domain-containing protein n=1 Tax=Rhodococcus aetherivorans TaxID=191292 RepID=UPI0026F1F123|nr:PIN domain-containing protein [Rhodococcus aetherivorans]WKX01749.1 PIN domain-containing protein [Rhodococcus aetherivorans]
MTFTVVYDANVLYPNVLRDVLIRLAQTGLVHARWTDRILDEVFRNLGADRPDIPTATLLRLRELMNQAVPDCLVTGYEPLIPAVTLPDPDDRHVLAAAIRCGAQVIVTANLRDFPAAELALFDIQALHPDEFVMDLFTLDGARVHHAISATAAAWRNPPGTPADVCDRLAAAGLPISAAALRR